MKEKSQAMGCRAHMQDSAYICQKIVPYRRNLSLPGKFYTKKAKVGYKPWAVEPETS